MSSMSLLVWTKGLFGPS